MLPIWLKERKLESLKRSLKEMWVLITDPKFSI